MIYPVKPVPKPRMTQRDKWQKRPAVMRYRAFADEVRLRKIELPESGAWIVFHMAMPGSWSKTKRELMRGKPHQQKPDLDNMIKALGDALHADDSGLWDYRASKLWADDGGIEIKALEV